MGRDIIEMKFVCHEDLDAMPNTERGRYCASCKKDIYDLTHLSVAEIKKMKMANPNLCGIMTIEQTDPNFIREVNFTKRLKIATFFTSIFFMTEGNAVHAQHTRFNSIKYGRSFYNGVNYVPIENFTDSTGNVDYDRKNRRGSTVVKRGKPVEITDENGDTKEYVPVRYKRKSHYWSRRFPFVHRRRRFVAGYF